VCEKSQKKKLINSAFLNGFFLKAIFFIRDMAGKDLDGCIVPESLTFVRHF